MKGTAFILLIVAVFGILKLIAPKIVAFLPEWANGLIFLIVFLVLCFQFGRFIFKHRRKDD